MIYSPDTPDNVRRDQTPSPDISQNSLDMSGDSGKFRVHCSFEKIRGDVFWDNFLYTPPPEF